MKSRIECRKRSPTLEQQPRSGDEDERERNLTGDEQLANVDSRMSFRDSAGLRFHRRLRIDSSGPPGRRQAEQQTRQRRHENREGENGQIELQVERHRTRRPRQQRHQESTAPRREHDAKQRAEAREQEALGDELPRQSPTARAKRESNGHFVLSHGGTGEQEVRNVRTRDQQHQRHDRHEYVERFSVRQSEI